MTSKRPWTVEGQGYPHICITGVPKSSIAVDFAPWHTIFELQPTWWHTVRGIVWPKVSHRCVTGVTVSQISINFSLQQTVLNYRQVCDKSSKWAPKYFKHYNVPHVGVASVTKSQFSISFIGTIHLQTKRIEWPPTDLEHYKAQGTQYMCYCRHRVPNFNPFLSGTNFLKRRPHCHKWTKWPLPPNTLNTTRDPMCVWVPNFNPFHYTSRLFRVTNRLRNVHRMTPKIAWKTRRSMLPFICCTTTSEFPIQGRRFSPRAANLRYRLPCERSSERAQNDIEQKTVLHIC